MPPDLDLAEGGAEDGAEESHLGSIRPTSTWRRAALPRSSEGWRRKAVFFECICGDLTRLARPDHGGGLGWGVQIMCICAPFGYPYSSPFVLWMVCSMSRNHVLDLPRQTTLQVRAAHGVQCCQGLAD